MIAYFSCPWPPGQPSSYSSSFLCLQMCHFPHFSCPTVSCASHLKRWRSPVACLPIPVLMSSPFGFPLPECGLRGHRSSCQVEQDASSVSPKCFIKCREAQRTFLNHSTYSLLSLFLLETLLPPLQDMFPSWALFGSWSPPPLCGLNLCPSGGAHLPAEHTVLNCLEELHLNILCHLILGVSDPSEYRSLQVKLCLSLALGHATEPSCFLFFSSLV